MTELLQPVIELLIFIPGMLLAYLPMKQNLRLRPGRLAAAMVPFILLLCLGGGLLWHSLPIKAIWIYLPAAAIAGLVYIRTLQISLWKSVSVFLAVCGVFSCLGSLAKILDFILRPENTAPWISTEAGLFYNLFCWVFVFLAWYPATHAARSLLEDDAFAQTWFVFWILPILFIALNLFITPIHPELMNQGRIIQIYIVVILALLFLLLMFYFMFYLMAASLNRNHRLRQENQFLSMQQMQYDSLRSAIAETREARHDMRHHFDTLMSLAQKGEWEKLEIYLADARGAIPASELNLCENAAADGIASHYALLYRKYGIPFSFALDLPAILPVPEIDFCVVLSNLLENALEASLNTDSSRQQIKIQAYLHSGCMILLTVENAFDRCVKEKNGVFQSSKRKGEGTGIQSIRRIAEKNGGYSRFFYENGMFRANVMLRAES